MTQSVTLFISKTVDHIIKIFGCRCKIMISPGVFLHFFLKIRYFMRLSSLSVNPKQKFWLRCAPPSSHMCGLYIYFWIENCFGYNIGTSSFTSNNFNVFHNTCLKNKIFQKFHNFYLFLTWNFYFLHSLLFSHL